MCFLGILRVSPLSGWFINTFSHSGGYPFTLLSSLLWCGFWVWFICICLFLSMHWGSCAKNENHLCNPVFKGFLLSFSSRSFMVSVWVSLCIVCNNGEKFPSCEHKYPISQHHLLKKISFVPCVIWLLCDRSTKYKCVSFLLGS